MTYTDILYEKRGRRRLDHHQPARGAQRVPAADRRRADRRVRRRALATPAIGVVVLTGAGDKAFCSGGDQKERGAGGYGGATAIAPDVRRRLHRRSAACPSRSSPWSNGFAIGGGHVLHVLCDLTHRRRHTRSSARPARASAASTPATARRYLRARRRREEGARDLVSSAGSTAPQEALADGPRQQGRACCRSCAPRSSSGAASSWRRARRRWRWHNNPFNIDSEPRAGIAELASTALNLYYQTRGGDGGAERVRGEAPRQLPEVPEVGDRRCRPPLRSWTTSGCGSRGTDVGTEVRAGVRHLHGHGLHHLREPEHPRLRRASAGSKARACPSGPTLTVTCLDRRPPLHRHGALHATIRSRLAPGMGLNAFVAFDLVANRGLTWPQAMTTWSSSRADHPDPAC